MEIGKSIVLLECQHFSLDFIPVLVAEEDDSQVDSALSGREDIFLETSQEGLESGQTARQWDDDVDDGQLQLKWLLLLFETDGHQWSVRPQ